MSQTSKETADKAEAVALQVDTAQAELESHNIAVDVARQMRDPLEHPWDTAYAILRTATRAVAKGETPGLDHALFGGTRAPKRVSVTTRSAKAPAPPPEPATPSAPST